MAQHDMNIANQGFPAFRSDLNNALSAIQTTHSGTSRPTGAVAGQIWLDTTSATSPTLKYYDGADDISLATIDHSANTVNWLDSNVSVTGLTTTATGTVITLSDTANTSTVNLIIDNQKEIRFRETTANGTNYVALKAPASLSADATFTLPSTDGTNGQALITNGSGVLSFSTISTSLATPLAVVGDATAGSEIRLPEDTDNGSNYVAIKAPNTLASNLTLTLPSADGSSGQVLQTNGSGVLSFSSVSSDYVRLLSTSLSGATSINVDGYFTSDYDRYVCFMSNVHFEGTNDGGLVSFRFRRSNADVTSSIYCSATVRGYNDGSTTGAYAWTNFNATSGYLSEGSSSLTYSGNIELRFHNPLEENASPTISSQISGWQGTTYIHGGAGTIVLRNSIGAISGFTIFGTANLTIKKLTLYGIKD